MGSLVAQPGATELPADEARLREARAGDRGAFEEVVRGRIPRAWRLSAAIVGDPLRAAEATQDAVVAAWRELPRLGDLARFDEWFERIVVNECRMQARNGNGHEPHVADVTAGEAEPDDADTLPLPQALDLLDAAFTGLDPEDRAIVVLHHLEGEPIAAIAEALHLPAGTVKWRLHEALQALRAALESRA